MWVGLIVEEPTPVGLYKKIQDDYLVFNTHLCNETCMEGHKALYKLS
jgi:hypothetical protein